MFYFFQDVLEDNRHAIKEYTSDGKIRRVLTEFLYNCVLNTKFLFQLGTITYKPIRMPLFNLKDGIDEIALQD